MGISQQMNHWQRSVPNAATTNCEKFIRSFINRAAHIEAQLFESQRRDQLLAEFHNHQELGGNLGDWINRYSGPLKFDPTNQNEDENGRT